MVLRKILKHKREEVTEDWTYIPYTMLVIKSKGLRWAEHEERMVGGKCIQEFGGYEPEGKRRRYEDNIKVDVQKISGESEDYSDCHLSEIGINDGLLSS
jgi:hypothetical protein